MKILPFFLLLFLADRVVAQALPSRKTIYLIPGQGSDGRLFQQLDVSGFETKILEFPIPGKKDDMAAFAKKMASQIDTTGRFSIIGVSLGGMVAVEMGKFLRPEEIILIASAKTKDELPRYSRFFKKVPVHRILGGRFYKFWTFLLQPLWEPMDKNSQKTWRDMLRKKDPKFMKRAVRCIIEWDNASYGDNVFHIHGTKDRTIRYKRVNADFTVHGGTHVMTMTSAAEISEVIKKVLK